MTTLSPAQEVARVSVIRVLPQGRYEDVEEALTIDAKHPGLAYEAIEAGVTFFYWNKTQFEAIQIAQ